MQMTRAHSVTVLSVGLVGIGMVFLAGAVLNGVTLELWFLRIIVTDGPAPRFGLLMLLAWLAGSYVAARLGGLRAVGIVALYALGLVSVLVMRAVIEPTLQCALVSRACPAQSYLDVMEIGWIGLGVVLGPVLARAVGVAIPARLGLVALSIFAIGAIVLSHVRTILQYTVCFSPDFVVQCGPQQNLLFFAGYIVLGVLAGVVLLRLGGRPLDALVAGGLLAVAFLPAPLHQGVMAWGDGLPMALAFFGPLLGALTFIAVAFVLREPRTPMPRAQGRLNPVP